MMRHAAPMTPGPADAAALRLIGLAFGAITAAVSLLAVISVVTNAGS